MRGCRALTRATRKPNRLRVLTESIFVMGEETKK
jgi:hypothetical protein